MLEAKIRALFEQLADGEQPPAGISIAAASRRGRKLLRWRRAKLAGTPVLAASAVVAMALTGTLSGQPGPAASKQVRSQAPSETAAPHQFSPLVPYAAFGWLPGGQAATSGGDGRITDYLNASAGKNSTWQLWAYAANVCELQGHDSALLCSLSGGARQEYPLRGRAPSVDGHRAFWLSAGHRNVVKDRHRSIVWQYARDGWAELGPATAARISPETVVRIASGATFGQGNRAPLDFAAQLTKVPADWEVSGVSFARRSSVMVASEYSVTRAARALPSGGGYDVSGLPVISVSASSSKCYFYPDGQSHHRVINGDHVVTTTVPADDGRPPSYQLCAPDADGLAVFITVDATHPAQTPVTLFTNLKLLGTNPANWTTQPVG